MAEHYIKKCVHGRVVSQCRCPDYNKPVTTVPCPKECENPEEGVGREYPPIDQSKLYNTTNAQIWAEEFMKAVKPGGVITCELMVGWFANAIEVARSVGIEQEKKYQAMAASSRTEPPTGDSSYNPMLLEKCPKCCALIETKEEDLKDHELFHQLVEQLAESVLEIGKMHSKE